MVSNYQSLLIFTVIFMLLIMGPLLCDGFNLVRTSKRSKIYFYFTFNIFKRTRRELLDEQIPTRMDPTEMVDEEYTSTSITSMIIKNK